MFFLPKEAVWYFILPAVCKVLESPGIKFKKYVLNKVCLYSTKSEGRHDGYENFLLSSFLYFFKK